MHPTATFTAMINAATYGERVFRAIKLRTPEVVELAAAARLPSSMKCTA
jgi:ABC-type proline/glycine betaine transport system permease subunit